ncbi:oligopeptide transporter 4-like [Gossypium australe]|uniref:Oligopeptide transporter 4-like n=1 Tax=Gossypium australe TaxID=47621 RepID=A0A5B6V964_9ROSI|nr:oligopeptide transporter 4-like [Gossypium australe]
MTQFEHICNTIVYAGVSIEVIKLLLISFTLEGQAQSWLDTLPPDTITIWTEFVQLFLSRVVLMTHVISTYEKSFQFKQHVAETLR